jgi:hypothetical protein
MQKLAKCYISVQGHENYACSHHVNQIDLLEHSKRRVQGKPSPLQTQQTILDESNELTPMQKPHFLAGTIFGSLTTLGLSSSSNGPLPAAAGQVGRGLLS